MLTEAQQADLVEIRKLLDDLLEFIGGLTDQRRVPTMRLKVRSLLSDFASIQREKEASACRNGSHP